MTKSNINDVIAKEKSLILIEFLKNAPFEGWSNKNLETSTIACGFDAHYELLLFPNRLKDLNLYFNQTINNKMTKIFLKEKLKLGTTGKIAYLIALKFSLYQPIKESIRCLFQYNLLPQNILEAKKALWQTCDQIWYLAGDRSTDFNYYSKRSLLSFVYSSSFIYYLSDESEGFADTKIFIDKKLQSVLKIRKLKARGINFFNNLFKTQL